MAAMTGDPRIDAYIARMPPFARPILQAIRARLHAATPGLDETIKWGMPFFTVAGRPFANMAGFKAHASFGFWRRDAAATGREGEAMGQFGRLTTLADLPDDATLAVLVAQALAQGDAPRPRASAAGEPQLPAALAGALAEDAAANAAFAGFAPSQRREYCDWVAEAKRDATRDRRVAQAIAWLREGKQRNWKYQGAQEQVPAPAR